MSDFNSMTLMAAGEMIAEMSTQASFKALTLSWGVSHTCEVGSVVSKVNDLVEFAIKNDTHGVPTINGNCNLARAMIEHAITASDRDKNQKADVWMRIVAGLKMDGFEIIEEQVLDPSGKVSLFDNKPMMISRPSLKRMLSEDIPEVDFRKAEDEVTSLLKKHGFEIAFGHLKHAMTAF